MSPGCRAQSYPGTGWRKGHKTLYTTWSAQEDVQTQPHHIHVTPAVPDPGLCIGGEGGGVLDNHSTVSSLGHSQTKGLKDAIPMWQQWHKEIFISQTNHGQCLWSSRKS